jgi:hypothetical protein
VKLPERRMGGQNERRRPPFLRAPEGRPGAPEFNLPPRLATIE